MADIHYLVKKHERADRLRNYVLNTKHEAVFVSPGHQQVLTVGEVLDFYWWQGVYWCKTRTRRGIIDIPADIINLYSPGM